MADGDEQDGGGCGRRRRVAVFVLADLCTGGYDLVQVVCVCALCGRVPCNLSFLGVLSPYPLAFLRASSTSHALGPKFCMYTLTMVGPAGPEC